MRLYGFLWFKRFLNHGRPQSYTEGFDGRFEMPHPDLRELVITRICESGSIIERAGIPA